MASPYGRIRGGSLETSTAGYTTEQIMEKLDSGVVPIPVKYSIEAMSPVWLRTEHPHDCLIEGIPKFEQLPEEEEDPPLEGELLDEEEDDDADDDLSHLAEQYPELSKAELRAVRDQVDILEVDEDLKDEFLRDTQNAADDIREFLFKHIAPLAVGSGIAFDEFNQELSLILGSNASSNFTHVKGMIEDAMTMKTFEFMSQKLDLSNESSRNVLAVFMARRAAPKGSPGSGGLQHMLKEMLNATKDA